MAALRLTDSPEETAQKLLDYSRLPLCLSSGARRALRTLSMNEAVIRLSLDTGMTSRHAPKGVVGYCTRIPQFGRW